MLPTDRRDKFLLKLNSRKGYPALPKEKRSENEVILTGLFCRAKLMTAIPENLRHMLGEYKIIVELVLIYMFMSKNNHY